MGFWALPELSQQCSGRTTSQLVSVKWPKLPKQIRCYLGCQQNLPMCSGTGVKQACPNQELLRNILPADKILTLHSWRAQNREVCAAGLREGSDLLLDVPWPADEGGLLTGQDSVIQLHKTDLLENDLSPNGQWPLQRAESGPLWAVTD